MDITVVFAYLFGIIILYLLAQIFYVPLKTLVKLIFNGIIGGLLLALFNIVGSYWGLCLAINPITALVAGLLGLPGILLLLVLRYILIK